MKKRAAFLCLVYCRKRM